MHVRIHPKKAVIVFLVQAIIAAGSIPVVAAAETRSTATPQPAISSFTVGPQPAISSFTVGPQPAASSFTVGPQPAASSFTVGPQPAVSSSAPISDSLNNLETAVAPAVPIPQVVPPGVGAQLFDFVHRTNASVSASGANGTPSIRRDALSPPVNSASATETTEKPAAADRDLVPSAQPALARGSQATKQSTRTLGADVVHSLAVSSQRPSTLTLGGYAVAYLTWSSDQKAQGFASVAGKPVSVDITYTNALNWTMKVSAANAKSAENWTLIPATIATKAFVAPVRSLEGSVTQSGAQPVDSLVVNVGDWSVGSMQLSRVRVSLFTKNCAATPTQLINLCPTNPTVTNDYFAVSGDVSFFGSGKYSFSGQASYSWFELNARTPTYGTNGYAMASMAYNWGSTPISIRLGAMPYSIPKNTFVIAGSYQLPDVAQSFLKTSDAKVQVIGTYSSKGYSLTGLVNGTFVLNSSVTVKQVGVTISSNSDSTSPTAGFQLSIQGTAILNIPNGPSLQATAIGSVNFTKKSITFSLSTISPTPGGIVWPNAFGLHGVNLTSLTGQVTFQLGPPIPSIAFAAEGTLDPSLGKQLGFVGTPKIAIAFQLSVTQPCLAVAIGSKDPNSPTAISLGNGALTASYAALSIAPSGCTIGTTTVPTGYTMAFNGSVFGVPTAVSLAYSNIFTSSASYSYSLEAAIAVGAFSIPAGSTSFNFKQTEFSYSHKVVVDPVKPPSNKLSINFTGGFNVGNSGNSIQVAGKFSNYVNVLTGKAETAYSFSGSGGFNVSGFGIEIEISFCANTPLCPDGQFGYSASGSAKVSIPGLTPLKIPLVGGTDSAQAKNSITPGGISLSWKSPLTLSNIDLGSPSFVFKMTGKTASLSMKSALNLIFVKGSLEGAIGFDGSGHVLFNLAMSAGISFGDTPTGVDISGGLTFGDCPYTEKTGFTCTSAGPVGIRVYGNASFKDVVGKQSFEAQVPDLNLSFSQIADQLGQYLAKMFYEVYHYTRDKVAGLLRDAGVGLEKITSWLVEASSQNFALVVGTLRDVMKLSVSQISSMLKNVYNLTESVLVSALKDAGYAIDQVAGQVKVLYDLSASGLSAVLKGAGYAIDQVAGQVKVLYDLSAWGLSAVLKGAGYAIDQVAGQVKVLYGSTAAVLASALKGAGYVVGDVAKQVKRLYDLTQSELASVLKGVGYVVGDVAKQVKDLYSLTESGLSSALKSAGYMANEVAVQVKDLYKLTESGVSSALKSAGYTADEVAGSLKALGYSCDQIGSVLKNVFNLGDTDVAKVLKGYFDKSNVESAIKNAFNYSWAYAVWLVAQIFG
jgi:hypothetical protein